MLLFAGICVLTYFGFTSLPTGFVPNEDQGYAMINIQLPTRLRWSVRSPSSPR